MCWKCGQEITDEFVTRDSECPVCKADLHSCRNCCYYRPGNRYDCHETIEEPVTDKERRNFCSEFKVKRSFSGGTGKASAEAKKAFEALFSV